MSDFPKSTYRLQITPDSTLFDAADVCDYIAALGADAVYLSPILTSTTGSEHGYDYTDPRHIDPQRGGEEGWQAFLAAAGAHDLKVVVDIVPNHMGISRPAENHAWWDVLTHGRDSDHASWFDINFDDGPIFVGILGSADDVDQIRLSDDATELTYYEHRFPVAPGTADPGDDPLEVHQRQHYRLSPWQQTNSQLNYRRFFAVDTLAGVRVELDEVFDATHQRIIAMVREDGIDGLRVDHPDGLLNPADYFRRLREAVGPDVWLIGEKILEPGEQLPEDWPIQGTTGYDAMTEVNQLFIDPVGEQPITDGYRQRTGDDADIHRQMALGKSMVAAELFPAEIARIMELLTSLDLEPRPLARSIAALAVELPVYRTYLPDGVELLHAAADQVRAKHPELDAELEVVVPRLADVSQEAARRFQQLTGAVMAKGVEDTAYYRANRFIALNEVGGNPARFGLTLDDFHQAQRERQAMQPHSMVSLSTHDTKRGEDVRARLAALSEMPQRWADFAQLMHDLTQVPNPATTELLAQTALGAGEIDPERFHNYAEKAIREAADGTTWTAPDTDFEAAVHAAVNALYENEQLHAAWRELLGDLEGPGWVNSLGQKLVQLTMPGIPDLYQGTEIFDDSLVDPDNRRAVDYPALRDMLDAGRPGGIDGSGAAKQWVSSQALRLRRDHPELFSAYRALPGEGSAADHLIGFDRGGVICLATRLPVGLARSGGWQDTRITLPAPSTDQLTGRQVPQTVEVAELFDDFPVALLRRS